MCFSEADVVRHPLVQSIVRAYERDESSRQEGNGRAEPAGTRPERDSGR
jgi:phosphate starvation-inducible protein PhoH